MNRIYATTFFLLCCILQSSVAYAQAWQWGQSGGSGDGGVGSGPDEKAVSITTDPHGNVYVLTKSIGESGLQVAGVVNNNDFGVYDVLLASFSCDGKLRWMKTFGCPREDFGYAVKADKQGNVYIAMVAALASGAGYNDVHIDNDYTLHINNPPGQSKTYKSLMLIKYDTSGNFKWVTAPQPDTVGAYSFSNTGILKMDTDAQGILHCYSMLAPGLYGGPGGFLAPTQGNYILKFSGNGTLLGGVALDVQLTGTANMYSYFKLDEKNSRYYISGAVQYQSTATLGGNLVKGSKYLAALSATGSLLWARADSTFSSNNGINGTPAIDDSGNVYIVANTDSGETFNGYRVRSNRSNSVMIMKMDKDGKMLWASNAHSTTATIFCHDVALRNSGEVILSGTTVGRTAWKTFGTEYVTQTPGAVYCPFIARFNTHTGKILSMDTLAASGGTNSYGHYLVADGRNNVHMAGELGNMLRVNGKTLTKVGGNVDFFAAKYGHNNCGCNAAPEPSFSIVNNRWAGFTFNYTGTPGTLSWDFGDGTAPATQNSVNHAFADTGEYVVCVTVTGSCGDNVYCARIHNKWPASVHDVDGINSVSVYPNPATTVLYIDGTSTGTVAELYNMLGVKVLSVAVSARQQQVDINHLQPGNYILRLTAADGSRSTKKITRQ